jgi:hypothetical protein
MRAWTSSTRHAVMRGPSLTGFGNRPDLTPAHHVDLLTGIGPFGPRIEESRIKPVSGREVVFDMDCLRPTRDGAILDCAMNDEDEFG